MREPFTSKPCVQKSSLQKLIDDCSAATKLFQPGMIDLITSEWQSHEEHLKSFECHIHDRSVQRSEVNAYLRLQFAQRNAQLLWQISMNCQSVFRDITASNHQHILGALADLEYCDLAARSAERVEFKPPMLNSKNCESFDDYLETLEMPKSFGARLLWQLAARTAPELFGYSPNSLNALFQEPFWTEISCPPPIISTFDDVKLEYHCEFNPRSLQELVAAAQTCFKVPVRNQSFAGRYGSRPRSYIGRNSDGTFQWEDIQVSLDGQEGRLFSLAFEQYLVGAPLLVATVGSHKLSHYSLRLLVMFGHISLTPTPDIKAIIAQATLRILFP